MKNSFAVFLIAGCLTLTACLFDKDDSVKHTEAIYIGKLSDLQTLPAEGGHTLRWRVPLDTGATRKLRGNCIYAGYIGPDSASVTQDTQDTIVGLYTNTSMGGSKSAALWRTEGAILSMDSASTGFTHYRAHFACEY